jgi:oligopeptidase A
VFPEKQVLSGLFTTIENLYQVHITVVDEQCYHADVQVLDIVNKAGLVGRIYLDIYATASIFLNNTPNPKALNPYPKML